MQMSLTSTAMAATMTTTTTAMRMRPKMFTYGAISQIGTLPLCTRPATNRQLSGKIKFIDFVRSDDYNSEQAYAHYMILACSV